ncbi:hypothetical protein TRIUR3_06281 [Triticum urartu]|uniref:Thylakoid lumenal 17.9 kDa protein, chloroplastic n=1 Tax=Triticum urartu TaxID=4572 RepID=M7Z7J3_TRIUA|nr:hypothetical protein TRIUR3_06281 [Triticum urartu]
MEREICAEFEGCWRVRTLAQAAANPFSTPYSQSRTLQLGLDTKGKIRTCPSTNPGCVCTNPTVGASSSVASPLIIPESTSADAAAQLLRQAILKTQKNVSFNIDQQTPHGHYIQAEVDGGFGRDVMEFLVKKDAGVVAYRCVATKVTFVYPFTTAIGDSRGQEQRVAAVAQELGWPPSDATITKVILRRTTIIAPSSPGRTSSFGFFKDVNMIYATHVTRKEWKHTL